MWLRTWAYNTVNHCTKLSPVSVTFDPGSSGVSEPHVVYRVSNWARSKERAPTLDMTKIFKPAAAAPAMPLRGGMADTGAR